MSRLGHYDVHYRSDIEKQNEELRAQIAAYTEEVELLNEHLEESREDNEYLSQKIYRIENDLAEERIENASTQHFLLRHNTPVLENLRHVTGATRSRVSFYGVDSARTSPDTTRTDSVFDVRRPDSVFDHPNFDDDDEEEEDDEDLDATVRTIRANSVTDFTQEHQHHHMESVDSNKTLRRRSMSYHDMSDVQDKRESHPALHRYHSYHAPEEDYDYDQEVQGYFDDELVPSTYYAEEQAPEECIGCKEADIKIRDLEGQIQYLDDQLEDKEKFIENTEFEVDEMKTQLRSVKLDKDIVEYELTQKIEFSKEKLDNTENCLKQKDQAYMDLLERFVSLEKSFEELNSQYKLKGRECTNLSDKLSTAEFDLMLAEEQLQKQSKRPGLLDNMSADSAHSSAENSLTSSPTSKHKSYNSPLYERRSSYSNFERCEINQQPLSIRSSGSSVDLWDIGEEEERERIEHLNRFKREAEKHAQIQDMFGEKKSVSAYELYRITKELADLSEEDSSKENVQGNAES